MDIFYATYIIATSVIILFFTISSLQKVGKYSTLHDTFFSLIIAAILHNDNSAERLIVASSHKQRKILAQALHSVIRHTYGCDEQVIQRIVKRNRIDKHIVKRLRLTPSHRRCSLLAQYGSLCWAEDDSPLLKRDLRYSNTHIRSSHLISSLATHPTQAIQIISALHTKLQPLDIVRIIALIRRGRLSIIFEPLVESTNPNLQMLGLAIARNFGTNIANQQLYNIISNCDSHSTRDEAIYTLIQLKRPLRNRAVKERLSSMSRAKRLKLCRHLAVEGYSIQTIKAIVADDESRYAEHLIASYKRQLT